MCGVAALFRYRPSDFAAVETAPWLARVNAAQRARGPDGEGVWVSPDGCVGLGHRRLAIIDLDARAAQPMSSVDGQVRVSFNGEIYNYLELRQRLKKSGCVFRSQSDTEVLLHLYRQYGADMTRYLRGMYAFVLWDEERQGMLLARDPFGIKPLYYADRGGVLRVASQVKALLAGGDIDTEVEPAGHVGFFLWGSVPEPYTLYRGVRALPAGTTLWVQRGNEPPALHRFGDVAQDLAMALPAAESGGAAQEQFRAALQDSVRHHLLADVPVGVFLSAGLDSTSLAAIASRVHDQPVRTLTLGFREYEGSPANEVPIAEAVAQALGARHETRWVGGADFATEAAALLDAMDQPTIDGVNSYFVSKAAHDSGLKVALSGLGGDELLGGYPSFRNVPTLVRLAKPFAWLGKAFRVVSLPVLRRFTSPKYAGLFEFGGGYGGAYLLRRGLYMPWELPEVLDADLARAGWQELDPIARLDAALPSGLAPFQTVSALELTVYMRQMLLRDTDWASMAHSLEVRVPLVDVELLRTVAALAARNGRPPDKKTMAKLAWHPDGAPEALVNRPKTGFSVPVRDWQQKSAGLQERGLRPWARFVYSKACSYAPR